MKMQIQLYNRSFMLRRESSCGTLSKPASILQSHLSCQMKTLWNRVHLLYRMNDYLRLRYLLMLRINEFAWRLIETAIQNERAYLIPLFHACHKIDRGGTHTCKRRSTDRSAIGWPLAADWLVASADSPILEISNFDIAILEPAISVTGHIGSCTRLSRTSRAVVIARKEPRNREEWSRVYCHVPRDHRDVENIECQRRCASVSEFRGVAVSARLEAWVIFAYLVVFSLRCIENATNTRLLSDTRV